MIGKQVLWRQSGGQSGDRVAGEPIGRRPIRLCGRPAAADECYVGHFQAAFDSVRHAETGVVDRQRQKPPRPHTLLGLTQCTTLSRSIKKKKKTNSQSHFLFFYYYSFILHLLFMHWFLNQVSPIGCRNRYSSFRVYRWLCHFTFRNVVSRVSVMFVTWQRLCGFFAGFLRWFSSAFQSFNLIFFFCIC